MATTKAKLTGKRCMCSACGEVFSTTANFDRHRIGDHGSRKCEFPSVVGLVRGEAGSNTFWKMPGEADLIAGYQNTVTD